jgi:hypothetical protein
MSAVGMTPGTNGGAGEAGREVLVAIEADVALLTEGRDSIGAGVDELDIVLASSKPPPDVTNGFSAVFFLQNDHFGLASSACKELSMGRVSGSPRRDRLVQLSRLSARFSF